MKRPGSTCKRHQGYCDTYGLCVTVDSEDQINTLRDTFKRFFSKETTSDLWSWIKREWYTLCSAVVSLCGLASDIYRSYKILTSVKVLSATSQ